MSAHDPEEPPPLAQPVLTYRPPEAPTKVSFTEPSVSAGCFTAGFFILAGSLLALVALKVTRSSPRDSFRALGFVFALPAAIGVALLKSRRWRPFASGLLIGVVVAVVFGGMCLWGGW